MENKNIGICGIGRLGIAFGLLCASKGYNVLGSDVREDYVESINNKTFNSTEPQINELLESCNTFKATISNLEVFNHSDLVFILVATPSNEDHSYNHEQIEAVLKDIEDNNITNKTIVISCTTMPKYCQFVQDRLEKYNINIVYNPEFIKQGEIIEGLKYADMVLMGGTNIPDKLFELYTDIMQNIPEFNVLSLTGAELAKIGINCFLNLKIAYANFIGDIALDSGETNIEGILQTIGSDSRINNKYLKYGFPASGLCIPRDLRALFNYSNSNFVYNIWVENDRHMNYLKEYWTTKNPDKNVPFIFSYLTYKPNTDIFTESKQLQLAIEFMKEGYTVYIPPFSKIPGELIDWYGKGWLKLGTNGMVVKTFVSEGQYTEEVIKGCQVN